MQKRWELTEYDVTEATELQEQLNIHPIFCQLLVQRGIYTFQQAKRFFRPQLSHLHDPFLMKDMERAVQRIGQAIIKKEKILLYGDYDVDGTTAVALLYTFLKSYHSNLEIYFPDRYKEGYGISIKGVSYAIQQECSLMIALDCGINAHEAIQFANEQQIDCIICDHHLPSEQLPSAYAILNPKQKDCSYPYQELSGCALGFKLVEAFAQLYQISFEEEVRPLLDFVVLSLACDFVPLTGENRVLAYYGLEQLNLRPRLSLKVFTELLHKERAYSIRDIVFGLGPYLNAAGRLSSASTTFELLVAPDQQTATQKVNELMSANQQRKEIEQQMLAEAQQLIQDDITFGEKRAIILFKKDWHKGVIGIVASKLVDKYHKPTIVLTESNGRMVGSARSIQGFDIHQMLVQCHDLLINYGGHKYAAGLSLKTSHFDLFVQQFQATVNQHIAPLQTQAVQYIDAELNFELIQDSFWKLLQQFAPFGPLNMRPVFATKQLIDSGYSKLLKQQHIKLVVEQKDGPLMEGIAFGLGHFFQHLQSKKPFEMCYVIEENTFKGRSKLQLNVKDMRFRS